MTLIGHLPKEPWRLLVLALGIAVLAIVGDTIHHGFHVEEAVASLVVGFVGTGLGCGIAKIAGEL